MCTVSTLSSTLVFIILGKGLIATEQVVAKPFDVHDSAACLRLSVVFRHTRLVFQGANGVQRTRDSKKLPDIVSQ